MACGEYGSGKFSDPVEISNIINDYFKNLEENKKFKALVTAGPTRAPLIQCDTLQIVLLENKVMRLQRSFKKMVFRQHLFLAQQI